MQRAAGYWTFVYFLQTSIEPHFVRIGQATKPAKRIKAIRLESNVPLCLISVLAANQSAKELLHFAFADQRVHGEWFHPHAHLKSLVRAWKLTGVTVLTPDIAEATLPRAMTRPQQGGPELQRLLMHYREAFWADGLDGRGKPIRGRGASILPQRTVDSV
jgi:hypothetical protein